MPAVGGVSGSRSPHPAVLPLDQKTREERKYTLAQMAVMTPEGHDVRYLHLIMSQTGENPGQADSGHEQDPVIEVIHLTKQCPWLNTYFVFKLSVRLG